MQLQDKKLRSIKGILNGVIKADQARQIKNDFVLQNQRL